MTEGANQLDQLDRLEQLLLFMVESTIDESDMRELEQLLLDDPAAQNKYFQCISVHTALSWRYGSARAEDQSSRGAWGTVDSNIMMEIIEDQARENEEHLAEVTANWAKFDAEQVKKQSNQLNFRDAVKVVTHELMTTRLPIYLIAAACLGIAVLVWVVISSISGTTAPEESIPLAIDPTPDVLPVAAQLRSSIDARWVGLEPGQYLLRCEEQITLANGLAEIELIDGARVVIEAPAIIELIHSNAMRLQSGKIVAYVPESAHGFEVLTQGAKIVDLGTEFGVEVQATGQVNTHVFEGEVVLKPGSSRVLATPLPLQAGEAAEIGARGGISTLVADESSFVRPAVYAILRDSEDLAAARWLAYSQKLRQDEDLLAYYSFDRNSLINGKAINLAAATRGRFDATLGDGRVISVPAQATDRFGHDSQALSFDRHNAQAIYVSDWPEVGELEALTVSCWFRLAEDHGEWALLVTQWNDLGNQEDGRFCFHLGLRSGTQADGLRPDLFGLQSHLSGEANLGLEDPYWHLKNDPSAGGQTSPADGWVHVVLTVQCNNGAVRMFRNGVEIQQNGAKYGPAHLPLINQPLAIGGKPIPHTDPRAHDSFFSGEIDDVAIYRRALTPEEVQSLFLAGMPEADKDDQ